MSRIVIALEIVLVALLAVPVSASPAPQQAGTPLKDAGDLLVGRWTGEGIYAANYPGVGRKGEKFTRTVSHADFLEVPSRFQIEGRPCE